MTIDKEMSFLDHLEIFRWHLIRAACAILFFNSLFETDAFYAAVCIESNLFDVRASVCLGPVSYTHLTLPTKA